MSAPLRIKIFVAEADPNRIEREFDTWARSVEVVSVHSTMASCGPSDDQWVAMALTVLYRETKRGGMTSHEACMR